MKSTQNTTDRITVDVNQVPEGFWKPTDVIPTPLQTMSPMVGYAKGLLGMLTAIVLLFPLTVMPGLLLLILPAEVWLADWWYNEFKHAKPRASPPSRVSGNWEQVPLLTEMILTDANGKAHVFMR